MTDHKDPDETQRIGETQPIDKTEDETQVIGRPAAPPSGHDDVTRNYEDIVRGPSDGAFTQRTERIYVADQRRDVAPWVIALVVALALIAGALIGYSSTDPTDSGVVAQSLVSTQGGTVTFDGTGRLTIPANALTLGTAITIRKVPLERRVRLGPEGQAGSVTYEPGELDVYVFEPEGLNFQQPVQIILPRSNVGSAVLVDSPQPRVIPGEIRDDGVFFETSTFGFDR